MTWVVFVCCGLVSNTIDECVYLFRLLNKQCHLQLMVEAVDANKIPKSIASLNNALYMAKTIKWVLGVNVSKCGFCLAHDLIYVGAYYYHDFSFNLNMHFLKKQMAHFWSRVLDINMGIWLLLASAWHFSRKYMMYNAAVMIKKICDLVGIVVNIPIYSPFLLYYL